VNSSPSAAESRLAGGGAQPRSLHPRLAAMGFVFAALVVFFALCRLFWPLFTVDDSYITLRYARNFAQGFGPTFNPGEPPVEGYTTFLWMVVLTIPHLLQIDAVAFAKAAGVAAMLACLWVVFAFARRLATRVGLAHPDIAGAAAVAVLACTPAAAVHAVSGMETALFTLLVSVFLYALTGYLSQPTAVGAKGVALAALLVGLTRPEGNILVFAGIAAALLVAPGRARRALAGAVAALYAVPGLVYFFWRTDYYGLLFPLPFYVKVAGQTPLAGARDVAVFAAFLGLHIGILILLGVLRLPRAFLPAAAAAAGLSLFFLFPHHIMAYQLRFLFPLFPLGCVVAGVGAAHLMEWLRAVSPRPAFQWRGAGWAICVVAALGMLTDLPDILAEKRAYGTGMRNAHLALAKRLASLRPENRTPVLAIGDAGAVPYYSQWKTIDTFGLNDPDTATTGRRDAARILSRRPDLVVLISAAPDAFQAMLPWEQEIYARSVREGMVRVATYTFSPDKYYLWVLAEPGTWAAASFLPEAPHEAAFLAPAESGTSWRQ